MSGNELIRVGNGEMARSGGTQVGEVVKHKVVLVRAGMDPKAYKVPLGTTWGQVFEAAGASTQNQIVTIGREKVSDFDERFVRNGEVCFLVPRPKNA